MPPGPLPGALHLDPTERKAPILPIIGSRSRARHYVQFYFCLKKVLTQDDENTKHLCPEQVNCWLITPPIAEFPGNSTDRSIAHAQCIPIPNNQSKRFEVSGSYSSIINNNEMIRRSSLYLVNIVTFMYIIVACNIITYMFLLHL